MKPVLLINVVMSQHFRDELEQRFDVVYAPDAETRRTTASRLAEVEILLTNGAVGFSAADIDTTPKLRLLSALGVGHENIDVAYAKARGILVTNGAGTNDNVVADHALALLLGVIRNIPKMDRATRDGIWRDRLDMDPGLANKRVGIVGLGRIGNKIARRVIGFDCEVGYHNRSKRDDSPYHYFADVPSLAAWADVLILATPGGPETRYLVDGAVLEALGQHGYLVNIARGSVVDTKALAEALVKGTIAGAGLDVYESEPEPPVELIGLERVVLTPHVAGRSPEAVQATFDLFVKNAELFLSGAATTTPI